MRDIFDLFLTTESTELKTGKYNILSILITLKQNGLDKIDVNVLHYRFYSLCPLWFINYHYR